jgi:hypothetical protein
MATWGEFERLAPALARFGAERLAQAPAYLATVRANGTPRVHPVSPIIGGGYLFVFMEPTSPKARDLRVRRWFALHNGVPDTVGSGGEFSVSGHGKLVEDDQLRSIAATAASYEPATSYILFELEPAEASCNGYGDVTLPEPNRWSEDVGRR